jgi:hypothetical protein
LIDSSNLKKHWGNRRWVNRTIRNSWKVWIQRELFALQLLVISFFKGTIRISEMDIMGVSISLQKVRLYNSHFLVGLFCQR